MRYYFPIHLNGDNRGCEAIAKGTAEVLGVPKEAVVGLCTDTALDRWLGVDKYVTLQEQPRKTLPFRIVNRLYRFVMSFWTKEDYVLAAYHRHYFYHPFVKQMKEDDVMLSTGGDMMCYSDNQVIYTNNYAKRRGVKTILWGCSMGRENLTPRKQETLEKFDVVYARESLSCEFFKSLGLKHVVCYPDPAFILEPEQCELPECFSGGNVIGINLSNYVLGGFDLCTPFAKEIIELFQYIIDNTDFHILLIPHVFWNSQDDRIVCNAVKDKFASPRVSTIDSEKLNYCQIRYVVSRCQMFIGARTHAVISAYATHVPALALGYSIKSKGIAKDVGMPEWSVVDSRNAGKGEVLSAFKKLLDAETELRSVLKSTMPTYKARLQSLKKQIVPMIK